MTSKLQLLTSTLILAAATAVAADSATIRGTVNFTGEQPKPKRINFSADPKCERQHPDPVMREDVVVNPDNTLKNVIVYVKEGLPEGKSYPAPKEPAKLNQKGCMYTPHVLALQAGQPLEIHNSDPTLHNVHALPKENDKFNKPMISDKVPPIVRVFDKPELPIKIKCEIHPWMSAFAGVFGHPFFAVTDEQGAFEIKGLPAGEYTVAAWHEKFGEKTGKLTVAEDQAAEFKFDFDGK